MRVREGIRATLALAALAWCGGGAAAAPDPVAALFPPGEPVCYAARFDAADLAAHPEQSVVAIKVMRGYPSLRESDEARHDDVATVPAELIVTFRDAGAGGTPRQYGAEVSCGVDRDGAPGGGQVSCGIACDGGDFIATPAADGALHLAIAEGRTLRIAGGCTNHRDYRGLGLQKGDRVFTLPRAPMEACR